MEHKAISIRPFIGAKDFELSRNFYRDLGFEEVVLFHNMSPISLIFSMDAGFVQEHDGNIPLPYNYINIV